MLWLTMAAKWIKLNWRQRLVLLEAAYYLIAARVAIRLLPFRWIVPRLGRVEETPIERQLSPKEHQQAQGIGWAIAALARHFPLDAKCLTQAVAGKWMLQRRGLPSTLYLGIDRGRDEAKWLEAHAWLRCGADFVTGEGQHERFRVLTTFTEE